MSDYLDHLAAVGLNQTRGFQFNRGELRPRLASQFEPAVPNASPAAWIDDEIDEVEIASADQAPSKSRITPRRARVSQPSAETPSPSEMEVYLPRQSLTAAPAEHESFDGVPRLVNNSHVIAPLSTAVTAERRAPDAHEPQLAPKEVQSSPSLSPPRSHETEQTDLLGEDLSLRTRGSPVSQPRQDASVTTLRQQARRRRMVPREQSPDALAPQAAFIEVRRFLDSQLDRQSARPAPYVQPSTPMPIESKESRRGSATDFIEDDSILPPSSEQSISSLEKARPLQGSSFIVTPSANQTGMRHPILNRQPLSRRAGQADRSVEDDPPVMPTIHVTIGRVEVRAQTMPAASASQSRSAPAMTLEDYLQRRKTGGGQ